MSCRFLFRAAPVMLACLIAFPASAGPLGGFGAATDSVRQVDSLTDRRAPRGMSAAQAAREAQKRYGGGRVLDVDEEAGGFRVKLLRNGDVRIVFIPR